MCEWLINKLVRNASNSDALNPSLFLIGIFLVLTNVTSRLPFAFFDASFGILYCIFVLIFALSLALPGYCCYNIYVQNLLLGRGTRGIPT